MHVGGSSLEVSTDGSSSGGECEVYSSSSGSFDDTNVEGVSLYTSSNYSSKVHDQSLHFGEDNDDIPLCVRFSREQWVGLDVILLNDVGVPVANGICRNSDPRDCVDANPLGLNDVGVCILNSLLPLEVHVTWRFFLRRWPLRRVLHNEVNLWDHGRRHEQTQSPLWPIHVIAKASANMIPTARLTWIRSIDGIAYWVTILSVSFPQMTVVQEDVANFFHARKLGLYVKRCGLRIFI